LSVRVENSEIQSQAHRFARALDDAGVGRRASVAVLLPNVPEFVYCLRGATWSGRTFTPVNWHLSADDIAYVVENCEPSALVIHADFSEQAEALAANVPPSARFAVGGTIPGFRSFDEVATFSGDDLDKPLAGTLMLYTSGTTGKPKGVKTDVPDDGPPPCLASRMGSAMLSAFLPDDTEGIHLVVAPLYHAGPSTYSEGAALLGSDVIIMEQWDPEEFLRIVESERVTSTFMVPTHFVRLLQLPEETRSKYDTRSLKLVTHGAAPVSPDVKRRMIEWLGPVLFEFYGGTEGGGVSIDSHTWLAHPGSVGRPRPGLVIHILDEAGQPLPAGEAGDVYFANDGGRFEYKDDPEKTASAYRGDLYTLGDIGYLDDEGFLYLRDRKADTIITGGVNVYPAQIESVLLEHPSVRDCCVVGLLDEEWGERVLAVVEPHDQNASQDPIREALQALCLKRLGSQQRPREYVFATSLPRTETGKLPHRKVRDVYRARALEKNGA
jgi:long-chain acyl-CoA synthetase